MKPIEALPTDRQGFTQWGSPMRYDRFTAIGEALYGPDWRRTMAAALGPHHPSGAREKLDHGLIARWANGNRPIPDWVPTVLIALLTVGRGELYARIARIDELAEPLLSVHSKAVRERMDAQAKEQAET